MLHDSTTFVSWAKSLLTHLARTFFLYALILKEGNIVISRIFKAHFIHKFIVLSIYILFCISYHSLKPFKPLSADVLTFPLLWPYFQWLPAQRSQTFALVWSLWVAHTWLSLCCMHGLCKENTPIRTRDAQYVLDHW